MPPYLPIPREALAELLRAAGSPLTPEEYPGRAAARRGLPKKYRGGPWRPPSANTASLVAGVGVVTLPFLGITVENIIIVIGLVTVTYFEYRVHRYFRDGDPGARSRFSQSILVCRRRLFSTAFITPSRSAFRLTRWPWWRKIT